MSSNTTKITVSLPKETLRQIEHARREQGLARSKVILQAIRLWLDHLAEAEEVARYEAGYHKVPEDLASLKAYERAASASLSKESW